MARRRCLGCGTMVRSGSRCPACQEAYRPSYARSSLPRAVKDRDGWRCVLCGATDRPLIADHIIPLVEGGENSMGNMQTLCDRCHDRKHYGD